MSVNLSLLPENEKNRVELDKQAAFLVWKYKESKAAPNEIETYTDGLRSEEDKVCFRQSIEKYQTMMGIR